MTAKACGEFFMGFYRDLWPVYQMAKSSSGDESAPKKLSTYTIKLDAAKRALGERGPVWWTDGAPDWNRHLAKNTAYAAWWEGQTPPITTE